MAFINGFCNMQPGLGQAEQAVLVDGNITVIPQQADRPADARLGKTGIVRHVDRAHLPILLHQNEDGLQIVFCAFLNFHCAASFGGIKDIISILPWLSAFGNTASACRRTVFWVQ